MPENTDHHTAQKGAKAMRISLPVSFPGGSGIWVFATTGQAVDAARLAVTIDGSCFLALPERDFPVNGLMPLYPGTGEPMAGLRWATTTDVSDHAELFHLGR